MNQTFIIKDILLYLLHEVLLLNLLLLLAVLVLLLKLMLHIILLLIISVVCLSFLYFSCNCNLILLSVDNLLFWKTCLSINLKKYFPYFCFIVKLNYIPFSIIFIITLMFYIDIHFFFFKKRPIHFYCQKLSNSICWKSLTQW